ncbi:MAG: HIRAN domain-containing protein [Terriglobia bacterium]
MGFLDWLFGPSGQVPVIDDPTQRGYEKEYRTSSDSPETIRLDQHRPKGLSRTIGNYVKVSGVSYEPARSNLISFTKGRDRRLTVERDPDNEYDPRAIKVIGHWSVDGTEKQGQVGWIPKATTIKIAEELPADAPLAPTIRVMHKATGKKNPSMRIHVWCPKKKRKKESTTENEKDA